MAKPQWAIAVVILMTATIAFVIGNSVFDMNLPLYLYILVVACGFFIHAVILIVTTDSDREYEETKIKGKA